MKELWDNAAVEFKKICGESLQRGDVKTFDDILRKIEDGGKAPYGEDEEENKLKSVGLKTLKLLKMLVGTASQASTVVSCIASSSRPDKC